VTDEPNRCEPPANAEYNSLHWLEIDGKPMTARWDPEDRIWSPERMSSFSVSSPFARSHARYLAPVPSPDAVALLVRAAERMVNAAVFSEVSLADVSTMKIALTPFKDHHS